MTDTAQRIYDVLRNRTGHTTTADLARELGLSSDRALRGQNGEHGILREAGDQIFAAKGRVLIRTMTPPGVLLTDDPELIMQARAQWFPIGAAIMEQCMDYEAKARILGYNEQGDNPTS